MASRNGEGIPRGEWQVAGPDDGLNRGVQENLNEINNPGRTEWDCPCRKKRERVKTTCLKAICQCP